MRLVEEELRHKLAEAEKKLAETVSQLSDAEREIKEWEEKYNLLYSQMQKLKDDIENVRNEAEKVSGIFPKPTVTLPPTKNKVIKKLFYRKFKSGNQMHMPRDQSLKLWKHLMQLQNLNLLLLTKDLKQQTKQLLTKAQR